MATEPGLAPESAALPSGTVTFVFTDIEGSTQRWDQNRAAMEQAVRRHDAILRSAIDAHGGHVFKTIGDAFCAAFARPERAVAAILDAQRAIAAEDFSSIDGLHVRAAIHAGTADERDGDYFGPAVNRVARLLAIGHGGQILVSGVTTDLVQGDLPPKASLRDLGDHRLRDLARPERVYQLVAPDLAPDFPPLRSLDVLPNNLPLQMKSFVGREAEIAEITALINEHRLVTLVGSGGVGKTRTSLQVAANLLDGSGDGVWFIELAPLARGDYIPSAVANALGLTLATEGDPIENLVRALKSKHALLVFDNCEHMVEPAAHIISLVLRGCPKIKIIASSRQGLGIDGEETYRIPSLEVPESDAEPGTDAIHSAAIALFVDRALTADKQFTLTDENAPIVADICRRLDGIPLAIELAASRVKMLSPAQLRGRLHERFRVLTGGSRDALPRQQTLRALIDWSHDLLDERERALFRRLGIFVKGFMLEGAVAVGSSEDFDELDLFDVLASLVDKSLVLVEPQGDAVRYRMLESTRAYASEKLDQAGERDLVADRHLCYLRDCFAELWERYERTARPVELDAALRTNLDDVRSALDGALARSAVIDGGELLANVARRWLLVGFEAEGITRCEAFLAALPAGESRLRARLLTAMTILLGNSGNKMYALELATQAVAQARASDHVSLLPDALRAYGAMATDLHRFGDAELALTEAEAIPGARAKLRIGLLFSRARLSQFRGDHETAVRMFGQLRKEERSLGDTRGEGEAALSLAECEHARGQTQRAITILRETFAALRSSADENLLTTALDNLAGYLVAVDDLPGAVMAARESIVINATHEQDHAFVAIAMEHLALVFALRSDLARAATLEGYVNANFARRGFEREPAETATHDRLSALLREGLSQDELARRSAEGAALTPEAAIAIALEAHEPR